MRILQAIVLQADDTSHAMVVALLSLCQAIMELLVL
jgi:hypothetical protein